MEERSSTTQEILAEYHELGNREALTNWRQKVPPDVRRSWIRTFIHNGGFDKLSKDAEQWMPEIMSCLPVAEQPRFAYLMSEYKRLSDEQAAPQVDDTISEDQDEIDNKLEYDSDRLVELDSDIEYCVTNLTDPKILDLFARRYFLSFEKDPEKVHEFFARQEKLCAKLKESHLELLRLSPERRLFLAQACHIEGALHDEVALPREPIAQYIAGMVVYGSAAIGPRDSSKYPRTQDTDVLCIPNIELQEDPFSVLANNSVQILGALVENMHQQMYEPAAEEKILEIITGECPALASLIAELVKSGERIDVHIAEMPDATGFVEGWTPLAGPHRVIGKNDASFKKSYEYFLTAAIHSARK